MTKWDSPPKSIDLYKASRREKQLELLRKSNKTMYWWELMKESLKQKGYTLTCGPN